MRYGGSHSDVEGASWLKGVSKSARAGRRESGGPRGQASQIGHALANALENSIGHATIR